MEGFSSPLSLHKPGQHVRLCTQGCPGLEGGPPFHDVAHRAVVHSGPSRRSPHPTDSLRSVASERSPLGVAAATLALGLGAVACTRGTSKELRLLASGGRRGIRRLHALRRRAVATREAPTILTEEVLKPTLDERSYRVLELQNGLQVLLASDTTLDVAAAALTVNCGTFQDTDERPGLAHFHEHMLFLGTDKYPDEDEYNKFLNEHGGDSNAYTMNEFTTYYFKVAAPHLEEGLDRFSQFFIAPTFNPSCVEREMNAVDSESTNYSTEDGWRMLQVHKLTSSEAHPFHRFDVGNLSTLGADDPTSTRAELIRWNKQHYQAGAMRLVVVGKDSLDDLQGLVESQFSSVRDGAGVELKYADLPWPDERLGRIVYTVPIKESRSISVAWPLPPRSKDPYTKPELYISHVLGHEGVGSLHDVLNRRGWVDQVSAGTSNSFSDTQMFSFNIELTEEGDEHRDEVLALLFEYVALVQHAGPQEASFQELAAMQEIAFTHREESSAPDDFAANTAHSLFHYPPKEALRGPVALDEWRPEVIAEYLALLQPNRCIVFVASPAFAEEAGVSKNPNDDVASDWQREQWYRAPFREEAIDVAQLQRWHESAGEDTGLSLPEPNPFIPEDFSLRGDPAVGGPEVSRLPVEVTPPKLILSKPLLRLWHKTDCTFKSPREYVLAHVHTPAYEMGAETVAMMRLFCSVVYDDLNCFAYDASIAGLGYGVEYSDSLSLSVGGFSDKLPELLKVVLERIAAVLDEAELAGAAEDGIGSERGQELLEKLDTQRELLLQDYKNFIREDPCQVGSYYSSQIMVHGSYHLDEYKEVLERPASLAVLASKVRPALAQMQAEVFIHGNVTAIEAQKTAEIIEGVFTQLGAKPLQEIPKREVTKLPKDVTTIFEYNLAAENPAQENCSTENIYQVGIAAEDLHRSACLVLACHIGGNSAFERLRTQEQLGYTVQSWCWSEQYVCGLGVLVQGARLAPHEVDERIEAWLGSFGKELQDMSEENFAKNVRAVVSERTQRYSKLVQETTRHWSEIVTRKYRFSRVIESVKALEALKKDDVVAFFREYIAAGAPERRKLSVRILGTSAGDARSKAEGAVILRSVQDLRDFKVANEIFPQPAPAEIPS